MTIVAKSDFRLRRIKLWVGALDAQWTAGDAVQETASALWAGTVYETASLGATSVIITLTTTNPQIPFKGQSITNTTISNTEAIAATGVGIFSVHGGETYGDGALFNFQDGNHPTLDNECQANHFDTYGLRVMPVTGAMDSQIRVVNADGTINTQTLAAGLYAEVLLGIRADSCTIRFGIGTEVDDADANTQYQAAWLLNTSANVENRLYLLLNGGATTLDLYPTVWALPREKGPGTNYYTYPLRLAVWISAYSEGVATVYFGFKDGARADGREGGSDWLVLGPRQIALSGSASWKLCTYAGTPDADTHFVHEALWATGVTNPFASSRWKGLAVSGSAEYVVSAAAKSGSAYLLACDEGVEGTFDVDVRLWRSTDSGVTWSEILDSGNPLFLHVTDGATYGYGGPSLIADGSLVLLTAYRFTDGSPDTYTTWVRVSQDGGLTWSTEHQLPASASAQLCVSRGLRIGGAWIVPAHEGSELVIYSSTEAVPDAQGDWTRTATGLTGIHEPVLVQMPDGTVRGFFRDSTGARMRTSVCADILNAPGTWTALAKTNVPNATDPLDVVLHYGRLYCFTAAGLWARRQELSVWTADPAAPTVWTLDNRGPLAGPCSQRNMRAIADRRRLVLAAPMDKLLLVFNDPDFFAADAPRLGGRIPTLGLR